MGFLLKIAVFGVVAYIAWTTARRWLGLSNPPARAPAPPQREAATAAAPAGGRGHAYVHGLWGLRFHQFGQMRPVRLPSGLTCRGA